MKKLLIVCSIAFIASVAQSKAQPSKDLEIHSWSYAVGTAGSQIQMVPGGKGTLRFDRQGEKFSNVIFVDATGKTHRLQPSQQGTNGVPNTSCKYPLPDACFATSDKSIGMCICKPTDISSGNNSGGSYQITMSFSAAAGKIKSQGTTNPGTAGGGGH